MLKSKVKIIIFIIFSSVVKLFSQEYIQVPDTTLLHNGSTYKLPIYANLQLTSVNNLEIEFEFDYTLLNITSITSEANNIIKEPKPSYTVNNENFKKGILKIFSSQFNLNNNKILCYIELETLYGLDSIAYFNPKTIKINGEENTIIQKRNAKINVGFALEPIIKEGISKVFPNPFDNEFIVDFAIETPTEISFTIFSSLGRLVYTFPNKTDDSYQFFDSKGTLIPQPYRMKFPKGYYKLKVKSLPWQFASGLYFLQMGTHNGIYNTNLLHLK